MSHHFYGNVKIHDRVDINTVADCSMTLPSAIQKLDKFNLYDITPNESIDLPTNTKFNYNYYGDVVFKDILRVNKIANCDLTLPKAIEYIDNFSNYYKSNGNNLTFTTLYTVRTNSFCTDPMSFDATKYTTATIIFYDMQWSLSGVTCNIEITDGVSNRTILSEVVMSAASSDEDEYENLTCEITVNDKNCIFKYVESTGTGTNTELRFFSNTGLTVGAIQVNYSLGVQINCLENSIYIEKFCLKIPYGTQTITFENVNLRETVNQSKDVKFTPLPVKEDDAYVFKRQKVNINGNYVYNHYLYDITNLDEMTKLIPEV